MVTAVGQCLCHESVSARDCCCLRSDSKDGEGDGSDDEMKKLLRLELCEKMKTTTLVDQEHGRVPGGGAHLRNGQVPKRGAQLRNGWVPKGVARSKFRRVSKGVGRLRIGRIPVGTAPLRKKNHLATVNGGGGSTSRGGAKPDLGDSPVIVDSNLAAHDIGDPIEVAARFAPGPVGLEVIEEEAVVLTDGEVVDDVVTVDADGAREDVDEIVSRATVDLGVDGDPIVLGVLSPAEYRNLVFNVCPVSASG